MSKPTEKEQQEAAAKKAEEEAAAKKAEEEAASKKTEEPATPKKGDRVQLEVPVNGGLVRLVVGTCTKAMNKDGVIKAEVELGAPPQGPKLMEYDFHQAGTPQQSYRWIALVDA